MADMKPPDSAATRASREARRAAARAASLRDNLKRRKEQARQRRDPAEPPDSRGVNDGSQPAVDGLDTG